MATSTVKPKLAVCDLRARTGLTQAQFAVAIDVGVKTVGNWESGKFASQRFTLHQIKKLMDLTGATFDEIFAAFNPSEQPE